MHAELLPSSWMQCGQVVGVDSYEVKAKLRRKAHSRRRMNRKSSPAEPNLILPELANFRRGRSGKQNRHRQSEGDIASLEDLQHRVGLSYPTFSEGAALLWCMFCAVISIFL